VDQRFSKSLDFRGVQKELGDLRSKAFLSSLFQKYSFDSIVHLAGLLNRASRQYPEEAMQVNIGSSLHLLQLAIQFHVTRFIFGSSISIYGPKRYEEHGEVPESEPASPNNVYSIAKRYVEIVGEQYRQEGKIQFIALRISMVVGAGAENTASRWRSEIFEKLRTSHHTQIHLPYASNEFLPLVHVADLVEMIQCLLEAKQTLHSIYNTPSDNWRCSDLADYIQSLNHNIEMIFDPPNIRGDPEAIDGRRFIEEFGYYANPIKQRMRQTLEES